ncbi:MULTISPECIES: hypothetical protein [unclassified Roseobacter]|uniref:hypothetical protein n=1 Tax=unclassified Roseobacter TaxID=196798 RepID=UPI001491D8DF|nr:MULTISPECIES: hypothetical protein [unclassified Roseobacter]NNW55485.1 hypothetical protein [Roseobacter sp. HKCCD8284]NNY17328.1 hypothetical protein [Roseobacter sp. HKCCD8191]
MTELTPTEMTALYMKDPLELTDEDIGHIIQRERERRKNFKAMPAKSAGKTSNTKAGKAGLGAIKLEI